MFLEFNDNFLLRNGYKFTKLYSKLSLNCLVLSLYVLIFSYKNFCFKLYLRYCLKYLDESVIISKIVSRWSCCLDHFWKIKLLSSMECVCTKITFWNIFGTLFWSSMNFNNNILLITTGQRFTTLHTQNVHNSKQFLPVFQTILTTMWYVVLLTQYE